MSALECVENGAGGVITNPHGLEFNLAGGSQNSWGGRSTPNTPATPTLCVIETSIARVRVKVRVTVSYFGPAI